MTGEGAGTGPLATSRSGAYLAQPQFAELSQGAHEQEHAFPTGHSIDAVPLAHVMEQVDSGASSGTGSPPTTSCVSLSSPPHPGVPNKTPSPRMASAPNTRSVCFIGPLLSHTLSLLASLRYHAGAIARGLRCAHVAERGILPTSRGGYMRRLQVWAGPSIFGPWTVVASHAGRVTYSIKVTPVVSTVINSEVRYFGEGDSAPRVQAFFKEITIQTGDSVATVELRLMAVPTGVACWVDINP